MLVGQGDGPSGRLPILAAVGTPVGDPAGHGARGAQPGGAIHRRVPHRRYAVHRTSPRTPVYNPPRPAVRTIDLFLLLTETFRSPGGIPRFNRLLCRASAQWAVGRRARLE